MFKPLIRSIPFLVIAVFISFNSTLTFAQAVPSTTSGTDIPETTDKIAKAKIENHHTDNFAKSNSSEFVDSVKASAGTSSKSNTSTSGWQFAFSPYLYATGMSGTVGARGRTASIDLSFGDVLKHFDMALMGTFEASKGRFVTANDFIWIKLSEKRDTPGGLFSTGKIGVKMLVWNPAAGYRVYESKAGSFDVMGGIRLVSEETSLDFASGSLPGFNVSQRKTWAAPTIGGHGTVNLSSKFFLSTLFDIGGGFGTHVAGQFYGGAGYRITSKIALLGGYRYLKNDYSDNNGFIFDTSMNGIIIGAKFSF